MSVSRQGLPRVADRWTFLYVERVRIERDQNAIVLWDESGQVPVPVAALALLLLGPGCTITHAAMVALADNACATVWTGEDGVRCYASGLAANARTDNLAAQARAWADDVQRMIVVRRLYAMRFAEALDPSLTLEQIRGLEGVRVRETYRRVSEQTGVVWKGRSYKRNSWGAADPVNRALSTANACLYGLCAAAIQGTGFSTALGFIHTGKSLSFAYDIADLYKTETTIEAAFLAAAVSRTQGLETSVRRRCRDAFRKTRLIQRIVPDVQRALGLKPATVEALVHPEDDDRIAALWAPEGEVAGGHNYGGGPGLRKVVDDGGDSDEGEGAAS